MDGFHCTVRKLSTKIYGKRYGRVWKGMIEHVNVNNNSNIIHSNSIILIQFITIENCH